MVLCNAVDKSQVVIFDHYSFGCYIELCQFVSVLVHNSPGCE
jgi:hypothetical protein